ncbi:MAG: NAD(P)H-binding protein [Mycolicibacter algericus]|uniref:3-beta hydroxysteroid dehydrogenase n=3 Tax=Mycolicibacter TaxID=1073531 RepID=A0A7I9Y4Q4_MYCAL|nr:MULTISPECIES: NAD(P)H-binding protein [Mycolicibacter]OQZ98014.1 3-beta hydroxysteroid dehydrogenase [Mycolicibacter algericus DSM 45454]ORW66558.1 3-beta hydroxysteroid dehydrogenase [Mycolicibacter senuensis]GFG70704.1 3-beta hydroxysteroid dehydrogenase [Mycolicibacter senuensis]GFG83665.1 3-beta hydroxysteroid dehydrogenase [Mycolicibacter algericus]
MKIAVAGGTGKTGRHVVDQLRDQGHQPVILARAHGVDLIQNTGIDTALDGVDAVIDVTDFATMNAKKARASFGGATANLLAGAQRNGVRHHVALSIIGIDRAPTGYYQGKLRQEEVVQAGPVPWTILRAAQFHEFAAQVLAQLPGPIALVPKMRSQPIAVSEVAAHLVDLATGEPQQMAPELAGPRVESVVDMARQLIRRRGEHRLVLPLRVPGAAGKAMAGGALLPTQPGPRGRQTYADWLAALTPEST